MNLDKVINIGVLGVASIAARYVIPAILSLPENYKLKGIASRDIVKGQEAASGYRCECYETYDALLIDPDIDAVYVPLPNALHYPYVKMALENGKHVLVEKSLGCILSEVEELVGIASSKNLALVENFQFRFHSQLATILQLVEDNAIGDLRSVRVSFGFPPFADSENIRYSPELGGGALLDVGAYPMKIAPYFLGDDIFLAQASLTVDPDRNVDVMGGGVLQQRDGSVFFQFAFGFDHFYQCSLELWGSNGKLSANRIFTAPPSYKPILLMETQDGTKELELPSDDHFRNMLSYFHALISENTPAEYEYEKNIQQATLINDFKRLTIK